MPHTVYPKNVLPSNAVRMADKGGGAVQWGPSIPAEKKCKNNN